jgi:hypothetical protein
MIRYIAIIFREFLLILYYILFNLLFYWFCNFSLYKKRLPEGELNTSKHVGVLHDADCIVNILCIFFSVVPCSLILSEFFSQSCRAPWYYQSFFIYQLIHKRVALKTLKFTVKYECILIDYFNNSNFSKTQIIRSLMTVIKPKHFGDVLMYILIFLKQLSRASVGKWKTLIILCTGWSK